ncbi:aspartyl/glutamyl-tRNA amidotransferase subunit A, partial [bacterium]|nr:aspartyl/glutamyl-tRNA amidotransferase subunit A [bacterium]MBU1675764.1 aspartyl/glutamyl-tRNA amidotransferase subunit A [bacterium]
SAAELDARLRAEGEARGGELNCFTWRSGEADAPSARGLPPPLDAAPLWGIGGVVKANICVRDRITDCGSRLLARWRPPYDATAVARLREAGAQILGATVMDEFGMGSSTEHSAVGPARNPHDTTRVPGGSSGGAAAAVAAGLAFFALGSDTGGSVRQPAHCCGVAGLRPTYGRVSRYGLVAYASSLDQIGPLAPTVADCAAVYGVVAGRDDYDATSLDASVGAPLAAAARPAAGLTIGVPRDLLALADADTVADFDASLDALRGEGVAVVDIALPDSEVMLAAYYVIAAAEASANLARFDGVAFGERGRGDDYAAMTAGTRAAGFGREVKRRILLGTFVLSAGYRDAHYERARRARQLVTGVYRTALAACDAIATPTAPTAAFPLGEKVDDPLLMYRSDVFTVGPSLAGLPALTVPTGRDRDGLPLSLQLTGPALGEETLFTLGAAVERARGFRAEGAA